MASIILIFVSNLLLSDVFTNGLKLVFGFSWFAVIVACLLGIITIYFSALRSANKASKVSPISSIRNSADIKIKSKKIKTPFIVKKIFGIGGEIAHKNFKRNKKKNRTTIISIIVSVSIFIGLSYFIGGAFRTISNEITTYDYNVLAAIYSDKENKQVSDKLISTTNLDDIDDYAINRMGYLTIKEPKYSDNYLHLNFEVITNKEALENFKVNDFIEVVSLGDYQYKKYLKELNLDYNEFQNEAILCAGNEEFKKLDEKNKEKTMYAEKYNYKNGDKINVFDEKSERESIITIGNISHKKPFGDYYSKTLLIVSDKMFNEILPKNHNIAIYYQSSNPNKLQDEIEEIMGEENYNLENIEENARLMNNLFTLVAIFLYGFIIVISLIGITNIFNTITTNMNLRKQEFAMLKSIGMTSKEFRKMIRLESVFIGAKSLIFGIPIGLGISYLIYHFMEEESGFIFKFPLLAIIISIVVVYLLITILMRYSMSKINKENTIETIRNDNI